jgi:hypothetical protein
MAICRDARGLHAAAPPPQRQSLGAIPAEGRAVGWCGDRAFGAEGQQVAREAARAELEDRQRIGISRNVARPCIRPRREIFTSRPDDGRERRAMGVARRIRIRSRECDRTSVDRCAVRRDPHRNELRFHGTLPDHVLVRRRANRATMGNDQARGKSPA